MWSIKSRNGVRGLQDKKTEMYGRREIEINSQSSNLDLILRADGNRRIIGLVDLDNEQRSIPSIYTSTHINSFR